jgi:uncharacterized protein YuzE
MMVRYFSDTDTLYIEFRQTAITDTLEIDENTQLDVDERGSICAVTLEHVKERFA